MGNSVCTLSWNDLPSGGSVSAVELDALAGSLGFREECSEFGSYYEDFQHRRSWSIAGARLALWTDDDLRKAHQALDRHLHARMRHLPHRVDHRRLPHALDYKIGGPAEQGCRLSIPPII